MARRGHSMATSQVARVTLHVQHPENLLDRSINAPRRDNHGETMEFILSRTFGWILFFTHSRGAQVREAAQARESALPARPVAEGADGREGVVGGRGHAFGVDEREI